MDQNVGDQRSFFVKIIIFIMLGISFVIIANCATMSTALKVKYPVANCAQKDSEFFEKGTKTIKKT